MTMPNPDATWTLGTDHLGRRVCVYDQLDSTNSLALSLGHDPTQNGVVFMARAQTAGRGQYGRTWQAAPESSVLMSVLLFPPPDLRRPALLTAWAAVSVCETILKLANLQATIKWPNDVLIDGKKVCGILIEQRTTGHAEFPLVTVAGIGLNVAQTAAMFEAADLPLAASLASMSGQSFAYEDVAKELIQQLDRHYHHLLSGDTDTLESQWKARLGLLGKRVFAEGVAQTQRGRLLDVTFAGVVMEMDDGGIMHLVPESLRQLGSDH